VLACAPRHAIELRNCLLITITQIHEGTNQLRRMMMARQLLKG
jgi:alkylation response protein AidB-like acyl-CoA dehydrogenase